MIRRPPEGDPPSTAEPQDPCRGRAADRQVGPRAADPARLATGGRGTARAGLADDRLPHRARSIGRAPARDHPRGRAGRRRGPGCRRPMGRREAGSPPRQPPRGAGRRDDASPRARRVDRPSRGVVLRVRRARIDRPRRLACGPARPPGRRGEDRHPVAGGDAEASRPEDPARPGHRPRTVRMGGGGGGKPRRPPRRVHAASTRLASRRHPLASLSTPRPAIRAWLADPIGAAAGLQFLSSSPDGSRGGGRRHRATAPAPSAAALDAGSLSSTSDVTT